MLSALKCRVRSLAPTECHHTCLWHRSGGRALSRPGRHAEDEENDDGWSDVVLIAPVGFALSYMVMVLFSG